MLRALISRRLAGYCPFGEDLVLQRSGKRKSLPPRAKTVIAVLFPYNVGALFGRNVARYACIDDYHRVAGEALAALAGELAAEYPGEIFVPFVDDSPIHEVAAASACGLGATGRHGLLIHSVYGSRVFIGTLVTTLEIPLSGRGPSVPEPCRGCGLCLNACPTGALSPGQPFQKNLCRSYITQKKGMLDDRERAEIKAGGMVWGCDLCSEACPWDKDVPITEIKGFLRNITPVLSRENLDTVLEDKPYNWRGRDVLLRNLMILEE